VPKLDVSQLVDTSTFDAAGRPGLTYRRIRGVRVVLEWCVRRLLVPRDGLPWAFGVGIDLPALINATPTSAQIKQWKAAFDAEVARTEFVTHIESTLSIEGGILRYSPKVTVARSGTYALALRIDEAGAVLAQFPIL
jgi:hypothetical protein